MSYNHQELPKYMRTAGKITVVTALTGMLVFVMAFIFDVGSNELSKVSAAGNATTTLTVLNTPPSFTTGAYEVVESSTSTPTNSYDAITWSAVGSDSNGAPYFLLICSTNATPTANAASGPGNLGTAPPQCSSTSTIQWGVSTGTVTDTLATVSTTTVEGGLFAEINNWYAWVCDDDPNNPRCNSVPVQGLNATNSSPFNVNSRPVFTDFGNDGPVDPGATLTFHSTSSDPDVVGGQDDIYLVVCQTNSDYSTTTNTCASNFLASTTISMQTDATAAYTLAAIVRDANYPAYGYIVDEHGHEALGNPIQQNFDVNNVAPTVSSGDIILNGGLDMSLSVPAGETTGFTLDFKIKDANSCLNAASTTEITGYDVSIFRTSLGTTTCDGTAGAYNPNNCYVNGVATTTWNLSCTATTTCASPLQDEMDYTCTFPLWFLADPTDNAAVIPAANEADTWSAAVAGIDDNAQTGPFQITSSPKEVISFNSLDILAYEIAYGGIEPGFGTNTLSATSTMINVGNTGLDQQVEGESMCGTFAVGNECPVSATSTIPESEQKFSSTSLAYGSPFAVTLSSTTPNEVELDVAKTISTSTPNFGVTYWGIFVPGTITLAGSYQGLNTFTAKTAEVGDW